MQKDRVDGDPKSRLKVDWPEYGVWRSEIGRSKSKRGNGIDSEYRVYRSTEREQEII